MQPNKTTAEGRLSPGSGPGEAREPLRLHPGAVPPNGEAPRGLMPILHDANTEDEHPLLVLSIADTTIHDYSNAPTLVSN